MEKLLSIVLKVAAWFKKRRHEHVEDCVLRTFRNRNWHSQSAYGVVARLKHDLAYKYARALFPPRVTEWASFAAWVRIVPARIGYYCERTFIVPSRVEADKILLDLFKRQLLVCLPDNPCLFQLRGQ